MGAMGAILALACLLLSCASAPPQHDEPEPGVAASAWEQELSRVHVEREGSETIVTLIGLEDPTYAIHSLRADDDVLIVELHGVSLHSASLFDALAGSEREWRGDGLVASVVAATDEGARDPLTRVEVALTEPADYVVQPVAEGLALRFSTPKGPASVSAAPPAAQILAPPDPNGATPTDPQAIQSRAGAPAAAATAPAPNAQAPRPIGAGTAATVGAASDSRQPATKLTAIDVTPTRSGVLLKLEADGTLDAGATFVVADPDRLVIDLTGVARAMPHNELAVESDVVRRVRLGDHSEKLRVVLDGGPLAKGFERVRLEPVANGLVLAVGGGTDLDALLQTALSAQDPAEQVAATRSDSGDAADAKPERGD
jgi:hypothetical protein